MKKGLFIFWILSFIYCDEDEIFFFYQKINKTNNNNENKKKQKFQKDDFTNEIYNQKIIEQLANAEIYADVGSTRDILNGFVDKCVNRSLYVYRNNNCHTCAKLLAMGKSTTNCPKCHKVFKYPINSRRIKK